MSEHESMSGWKRFWERGGWWKALVLVAVYYGVYLLLGLLSTAVFGKRGDGLPTAESSALDIFLGTGMPIVLASIVLLAFGWSIGWLKELFGPQPIRGRRWMWIAIVVVLGINISAALSVDYEKAGAAVVASWLLTGLFVGFAEETLTRGFVVNLMRKAGHREIAVALVSSALFAAMHAGNFFTSAQGLSTTAFQVVYTFFFGICMYLALRLTGSLIWPILLHASTDPMVFLYTTYPTNAPFAVIARLDIFIVIGAGIVLLIALIISERRRTKDLIAPRRDLSVTRTA
ncbi:CPBP family intramembrane glutamic endopeptidase [Leifsonia sp. A12D58]|uniref:CPBP family intramembrane glutamic endopeptidase n=1 Tax=Leifsonia sp. A12D58 TaxID=3397674 RepID=UPI0039E17C0E